MNERKGPTTKPQVTGLVEPEMRLSKKDAEELKCKDCLWVIRVPENPQLCWCRRRFARFATRPYDIDSKACRNFVDSIALYVPSLKVIAEMWCFKAFLEDRFGVKLPDVTLRLVPPWKSSMYFEALRGDKNGDRGFWGGCLCKDEMGKARIYLRMLPYRQYNNKFLLHEMIHLAKPEASEEEVENLTNELYIKAMMYVGENFRQIYRAVRRDKQSASSRCWVWMSLEGTIIWTPKYGSILDPYWKE